MTKWDLYQECKFGLTFENRSIQFTILTDQKEKTYNHFKNAVKELVKMLSNIHSS